MTPKKHYKCECGWVWYGSCPICDVCTRIGWEDEPQDVLDCDQIYSIDEVLEEIEGKDDELNDWRY